MSAHIVTPLIVRDAEALAWGAIGMPGEFSRAGVLERVTAIVMRVDVAAREQALADKGGPELLAALKRAGEWIAAVEPILPMPGVGDTQVQLLAEIEAAIAKAGA